jgi:hypothetical protein
LEERPLVLELPGRERGSQLEGPLGLRGRLQAYLLYRKGSGPGGDFPREQNRTPRHNDAGDEKEEPMRGAKHGLPLGTRVSFKEDPYVYRTCDYQEILQCESDCEDDHDCLEEPYICVEMSVTKIMPLSQLQYVFDDNGRGRAPDPEELAVK